MRMHGIMGRMATEEDRIDRADAYRVLWRLLGFIRPYKLLTVICIISTLLYSGTIVANPWLIQMAIDSVVPITSQSSSDLTVAAILLGINAVLGYASNYVNLFTLSRVGQNLLFGLRTATFNHLQKLSISYFDKTQVGSNMSRVQNDVQQLQEFLAIFILALGDLLVLGGIIIAMILMDWQLALITLTIVPVLFTMMVIWQRYAWPSFMRVRRAMASVNSGLQENITGVRVVQSLNRQKENLEEFDRTNGRYFNASLRATRLSAALNPSVEVVSAVATGLMIVFGGMMVLRGEVGAVGVLVAFALYIQRLFDPIRSLTMHYGQLQRAMTSGQHILEILDMEPLINDKVGAMGLPPTRGEVSYEHVGFAYTPDVQVLRDINLVIKPGEKVALVGPTGAGKSTMVSLLTRLYDVNQGRITVDGYDLRDVTRNSLFYSGQPGVEHEFTDSTSGLSPAKPAAVSGLPNISGNSDFTFGEYPIQKQISIVPQDPFLFSGTIEDNIRYCQFGVMDEDIIEAAKLVGAHDFISGLEKGYDSQVEERGGNLSLGQRQLISLARALVANPRIVILDEATATVDSHSEMLIQRALKVVLEGRTALIIAHRLSTVRGADRIVVMDQGRIVEQGNHRELLRHRGLYARLYALNRAV